MKIVRVQYDGSGEWADVTFLDGTRLRFYAEFLHCLSDFALPLQNDGQAYDVRSVECSGTRITFEVGDDQTSRDLLWRIS